MEISFIAWAFSFQMVGFSVATVDPQEGDCLTLPQIQELVGAEDSSVYIAGTCKPKPGYPLSAKKESEACGSFDNHLFMEWKRKLKDHTPPGLGLETSDCMTSVTEASYYRQLTKKIKLDNACFDKNSYVSVRHTETFATQEFGIGTGKAFLPAPLEVFHEEWTYDPATEKSTLSQYKNNRLDVEYLGFGRFEAKWMRRGPDGKKLECKIARLKPGKNSEQKDCAQITKITNCL